MFRCGWRLEVENVGRSVQDQGGGAGEGGLAHAVARQARGMRMPPRARWGLAARRADEAWKSGFREGVPNPCARRWEGRDPQAGKMRQASCQDAKGTCPSNTPSAQREARTGHPRTAYAGIRGCMGSLASAECAVQDGRDAGVARGVFGFLAGV
jgi:hypothetical protein